MKTTVFFLPEAGIRPYMRALCLLSTALKNQGHRVLFTKCSGEMFRCSMFPYLHKISAKISNVEKNQMCKQCNKIFLSAQKHYGFESICFKDIINDEMIKSINELVDTTGMLEDIKFNGFPIGKVAQYDYVLEKKQLYSENLGQEYRDLFIAYIKNTALAVALSQGIYDKYNPETFVTFNVYAQCQAVRFTAEKNNAFNFHIHHPTLFGFDGSQLEVYTKSFLYHLYQNWDSIKHIPIPSNRVIASWEDSIYRTFQQGSHIYSPVKGNNMEKIIQQLNLDVEKKIFVAYTSSQDESLGGDKVLQVWNDDTNRIIAFDSQIEWLKFLQVYVKARDDIQIVVRIHPREGKNKNYAFGSKHLEQLKKEFSELHKNFIIVWPEDPISSYDLLELASGVLIRSTTIGLEASRIGIPVLCYIKNHFYCEDDFISIGSTIPEYKEKMDALISKQYHFEYLIKAIRYNHMRIFLPCIDLSETVSQNIFDVKWPSPPINKEKVVAQILNNEIKTFDYNVSEWKTNLPQNADEIEVNAVCYGIRLYLDKLFYPVSPESNVIRYLRLAIKKFFGKEFFRKPKKFVDYTLKYSEDISKTEELLRQTKDNKNLRIFIIDGIDVKMLHKGKAIKRKSLLVAKLAKLHNDNSNT